MTRDSELHPGMVLCVPSPSPANSPTPTRRPAVDTSAPVAVPGSPGAPTVTQPPTGTSTAGGCTRPYAVVTGDSWSAIARRHSVTTNVLLRANRAKAQDLIYPGQLLCLPTKAASAPSPVAFSPAPPTPDPATPDPAAGSCEEALQTRRRALCMDLSERRAVIGGRNGITHEVRATAGYGRIEDCERTVPGVFTIGLKQPVTPRRRLKWGMSFGGGCIGDQIVHAVSEGTMASARGTRGCIGLLETDAKVVYDTMRVGDLVIIID